MNETEGTELVAADEPDMGIATPMPTEWFCAMWVPVFCAILWGMMILFGQQPGVNYRPEPPEPPPE